MSLFAAFLPPPGATQAHADALAALTDEERAPIRVGGRERWHVTVAFYGNQEDTAPIEQRLERLARRTPPLRLGLSGAGTFGQGLLWAGLIGDTAVLQELMRRADDATTRTPRPHLTLGRARHKADDLAPLATRLAGVKGAAWTANELVLIRSHPGPPPRHDVVASWSLGRQVRS